MAKPSKGKKAIKADQRAAKQGNVAQAAQDKTVKEQAVQKAQAIPAEKSKNDKAVSELKRVDAPKNIPPAKPTSFVDRSINFIRAHVSLYTVAIIILFAFMLYLRAVPAHDSVFTSWPWIDGSTYVNVAEDDGVYHMRLLDNTLQHFPFRILYDPFTHFPYGNTIHFGPLFELIPATFLLIVGLGHPSQMLIQTVAAYFPTLLGALTVIPVYYIGKKLFGRPAGLIAALAIAFMKRSAAALTIRRAPRHRRAGWASASPLLSSDRSAAN